MPLKMQAISPEKPITVARIYKPVTTTVRSAIVRDNGSGLPKQNNGRSKVLSEA